MKLPEGRLDGEIPKDCITNKTKAYEYLGSFATLTYYNDFVFEQDKFGEKRITRKSSIKTQQSPKTANYFQVEIQNNYLTDEASILQLAHEDDTEFNTFLFEK